MKKGTRQSYVVTFCNSGTGKGGSEPSSSPSPLMERRQGSSTDLLIDPRQNRSRREEGDQGGGDSNNIKMDKVENKEGGGGKDPKVSISRMRDKFRGCLLGALVGDCIGTLFERDYSVSLSLLEDLYHSLTNLSEDEKLMDLHGIDSALGPKRIKEILETKRQSYASIISESGGGGEEDDDEGGGGVGRMSMHLNKPMHMNEGMYLRRNSALAAGTASTIKADGGGVGGGAGTGLRRGSFSRPMERYSDDTVMTKSVLYSVIKCKGLDPRHLAKQLTEDYFLNMNRKFGGYIRDIFVQLRENGYGDPYQPAKKYSGGIGAQGNEAASRVSPIALFCWNLREQQIVAEMASKQAKLTNGHRSSVHGTVLQALAVHAAFNWDMEREPCKECGGGGGGLGYDENNSGTTTTTCTSSSSSRHGSPLLVRRRQSLFGGGGGRGGQGLEVPVERQPRILVEQQPKYFCEQVLEKMNVVEGRGSTLFENLRQLVQSSVAKDKEFLKPAEPTYCDKLRTILEFLARSQPPTRIEVIERLGNGFKAMDSVPTAIYSFLFATKYDMLPEMTTQIKSPILRCIFHAISLGGETDTLASMAGAIAGAYWGYSHIPPEILRVCEGSKEVLRLADELFSVTVNVKNVNKCPSCHH